MATLNGILKDYRSEWPGGLSDHQYSTLSLIAHCRSGVLGSIGEYCRNCGHSQILPQSCGNRHCPLCLGSRGAQWSAKVTQRLPEVPHFHVVFTLPLGVAEVMRENFKVVGDLFFGAVNTTLRTFMRNNLHCEGGYMGVMHTWGSNLSWHPHIHTIVCGGGYRLEGGRWVAFSPDYLFAVRALSRVFRAIFLRELREADARGAIVWGEELADPQVRRQWWCSLATRDWVVYAEPTLKRTRALVRYLARYTCRTAISNSRISAVDPDLQTVSFSFRDYRNGGVQRCMNLPVRAFISRFAAHIAPRGFRRIRYYGFLARRRLAEPAAEEKIEHACPNCQGSCWTRIRIPANIRVAPDVRTQHEQSTRIRASASRSTRRSFSLLSGSGPPPGTLAVQQANAGDAD